MTTLVQDPTRTPAAQARFERAHQAARSARSAHYPHSVEIDAGCEVLTVDILTIKASLGNLHAKLDLYNEWDDSEVRTFLRVDSSLASLDELDELPALLAILRNTARGIAGTSTL